MKKRSTKSYERALFEAQAKRPNFERVYGLLYKAHKANDPRATYALGTWYLYGRHVKTNLSKALKLIAAAARNGVAEANFDLAVSLEIGEGLPKNERLAATHYLVAALSGDHDAVFEVGRCYYYGIGVPADLKVAKVWLDRASELGTYEAKGEKPRKVASRRADTMQ